jgi:hypothetical protein
MNLIEVMALWFKEHCPEIRLYRSPTGGLIAYIGATWIMGVGLKDIRDSDKIRLNEFTNREECICCANSYVVSPADPKLFEKVSIAVEYARRIEDASVQNPDPL